MNQALVIFKPESPIDIGTFQQVDWLKSLLKDQDWDVGQGRYQVLQQLQIFKYAQILNLKQLKLRWVMNSSIIQQISTVAFPQLKQLFLNGNNLTSIELITEVDMPNLQNLNLKQNNIVSLRCLRKCYIPNLRQISLYKNKITDVEFLFHLGSKNIERIWYNGKLEDGNIINSITWVAKLQTSKLKSFIIKHNKRIEQQNANQAIGRKTGTSITHQYTMQDDRLLNWI